MGTTPVLQSALRAKLLDEWPEGARDISRCGRAEWISCVGMRLHDPLPL